MGSIRDNNGPGGSICGPLLPQPPASLAPSIVWNQSPALMQAKDVTSVQVKAAPTTRTPQGQVADLHSKWLRAPRQTFSPYVDQLWVDTARVMAEAGLPWCHVGLDMPETRDPSWPLHFKSFERRLVVEKGRLAGYVDAAGYICNWLEGNQFGIRAIQHELRYRFPTRQPLLVSVCIDKEIIESASTLFGLETIRLSHHQRHDARKKLLDASQNGLRPVIFAATLGGLEGQADDFDFVRDLCLGIPHVLHIDASRTFDYITSASSTDRIQRGIPKLLLRHPFSHDDEGHVAIIEDQSIEDTENGGMKVTGTCITAATIAAAGANHTFPPMTTILMAPRFGTQNEVEIEYVRCKDSTLAGARDQLDPLWTSLQHIRFGVDGFRRLYSRCHTVRKTLVHHLSKLDFIADAPPMSLDVLLRSAYISPATCRKWGFKSLSSQGDYLFTIQPSISECHIKELLQDLTLSNHNDLPKDLQIGTPELMDDREEFVECAQALVATVNRSRTASITSAGYPFNQGTYAKIGSIVGEFLTVPYDPEWIQHTATELISSYKRRFGVPDSQHHLFPGTFTSGGTMSNRVCFHAAMAENEDAFVYFSSHSHYSFKKTFRDNDRLNNLWATDKYPRYVEIPCNAFGCINVDHLLNQALKDQEYCRERSKEHKVVLLLNIGTTFTGGRDDILQVRRKLGEHGINVVYVAVDGALDLGFDPSAVALGPPGQISRGDVPVVQSITFSLGKSYGLKVASLAICYNSVGQLALKPSVSDPRTVLELWIFHKLLLSDHRTTWLYCLENAARLRQRLVTAGFETIFSETSTITALERPPPWCIESYHLAPLGDWVHFINMPHITPQVVDAFCNELSQFNQAFRDLSDELKSQLTEALGGQDLQVRRLRGQNRELMSNVIGLIKDRPIIVSPQSNPEDKELESSLIKYVQSTVSFVAVSASNPNRALAVFSATANAAKKLTRGPMIVKSGFDHDTDLLLRLRSAGFASLVRHLGLTVTPEGKHE